MFCMTCSMRLMLRLCERQRCPGRGPGWALAGSGVEGGLPPTGHQTAPARCPVPRAGRSKVPGQVIPDGTLKVPTSQGRLNLGARWLAKLGSTSCSTTLLPECRSNWDGRLN